MKYKFTETERQNMPPKVKFNKEKIVEAALAIVRERGIDALSARALGKKLGCSPQPIFSCFENMEEVQNAVTQSVKELYSDYIHEGLNEDVPFKGVGMKYIRFAKEEPNLFAVLFSSSKASDEATHYLPALDDNAEEVLARLQALYALSEEKARAVYNHIAVYTHGLAVLFAQKTCVFTMQDAGNMLTEAFAAFMKL